MLDESFLFVDQTRLCAISKHNLNNPSITDVWSVFPDSKFHPNSFAFIKVDPKKHVDFADKNSATKEYLPRYLVFGFEKEQIKINQIVEIISVTERAEKDANGLRQL